VPVAEAPYTILMPASSLSLCRNTVPGNSAILRAMYSGSSFWGVIG